jgi:hypothetical protein
MLENFQFLKPSVRHYVELFGLWISQFQGLYIHKTAQDTKRQAYINALSGVRTQCSSGEYLLLRLRSHCGWAPVTIYAVKVKLSRYRHAATRGEEV